MNTPGGTRLPVQEVRRTPAIDPTIARAHKMAERIFADRTKTIASEDFYGKYGKDVVQADMRDAESKLKEYEAKRNEREKEAKIFGDILEAIIMSEGEESGWLGKDARIQRTTAHDDLKNHTDMIASWERPGGNRELLALAVDVTFGTTALDDKMIRIRDSVDRGGLGRLKYVHGAEQGVPRVVIGISKQAVKELTDLWVNEEYEALRDHPVQRAILEEMQMQLEAIASYAISKNKPAVASAYRRSLITITTLLRSKQAIQPETYMSDPVFKEIKQLTAERFGGRQLQRAV